MNDDLTASSRRLATLVVSLIGWLMFSPPVSADPVDAELVLLVDVTRSVSNAEFGQLMESFAQTFESAGVVDAIQAGTTGALAVSLVFYSHRNRQAVGVDWMQISDANSAATFAAALRATSRPFRQNQTGIANALERGAGFIGDETGGPANLFESTTQGVFFVADGIDTHTQTPNGTTREEVLQGVRDDVLRDGVDVIGALTVGAPGTVDDYFTQNVVGGQVGGIQGEATNAVSYNNLVLTMQPTLVNFIGGIVPEPGVAMLVLSSIPILGRRTRTASTR